VPIEIPNTGHIRAAIEAAKQSFALGDYAVGSAIAMDDVVVAASGNRTHLDADATQHAGLIVIRAAAKALGKKDLSGSVLYATHEPCAMCMGAIIWARVSTVVFGASIEDHKSHRDEKGNRTWRWRVVDVPAQLIADRGEPRVRLIQGFMRDDCLSLFHS
jgi:tRNA(adenine34) deaminase